MGQQDRRADQVEQFRSGSLRIALALHRIGESRPGTGEEVAERRIVDGPVAGPLVVQPRLRVVVHECLGPGEQLFEEHRPFPWPHDRTTENAP